MKTALLLTLTFGVASLVSLIFTQSIIDLAEKKKLFDVNNALKRHAERVSSLGGIAVFSAFWLSAWFPFKEVTFSHITLLFASSFLLFAAGVKDDLVGLPAFNRLFIQIGVASLLFFGGIKISVLPGLDFPLPEWGSYLLSIFLMGAIVNAYNFIDGANGLAGGLALIGSVAFCLLFLEAGEPQLAQMALALAGGIFGFLFFNFGKAKVFMGDNGSTFIGIVFSFLVFAFLQPEVQEKIVQKFPLVVVLAILLVPLTDLFKVVAGRMLRRQSPFRGDRTHIHHLLENVGLSHKSICGFLCSWNIFVIIFSLILLPQNFYLAGLILVLLSSLPYAGITLAKRFIKEKEPAAFPPPQAGEFT